MIDDDECGAVGGTIIGRGNRSTRRKPTPLLLCPPQISHDLPWARTTAAVVGSRLLTASVMARSSFGMYVSLAGSEVLTAVSMEVSISEI
jgi:hypothetical protein